MGLVFITSISSCGDSNYEKSRDEAIEKYDCSSIDDCLSQYNFEGARAHMAANDASGGPSFEGYEDNIEKVSRAESIYHSNHGEYERALKIIDEDHFPRLYEHKKHVIRYNILEIAVDNYCEEGNFIKAKQFALKASSRHGLNGFAEDDIDKNQQAILLKKIKTYQNIMK